MANLIEMSEQLKAVPDEWLSQQVENPSGMVPPYLALSELNRRKSLRSKMAQAPQSTVAQDVVGAPPAPPGMATPDMLQNQQPQPQLPQSAPAGVPSPLAGGLAASAPPRPVAPPAPQRMAGGGVVGITPGQPLHVTLDQGPQWFDDEDQPWWKRGLGMYGLSSLGGMGGLGIMGGIGPALLAGLFAKRGKKASAAAPATPAAPAALAEGGPVRLAGGGNYFSSMRLPYNYGTTVIGAKNPDDLEIITDEFGNRIAMKGGRKLATFAPQPEFKFPEYKDTTPKSVKRPELSEMLAEVQRVTARPDTGPTALDRRIEALEGQRDKIRKPFWGDALTELGLGILASKSPYGAQAVGEAGLGALQSWRQRQSEADRQRLAIEDRLLGVESHREDQAERNRRADLELADSLAGRVHGASVTEAQLESAREAQRQRYELEMAKVGFEAKKATHAQDTALNTALLNYGVKDPRNLDPNAPEVLASKAAAEKELIEHRAKMEARYRKNTDGSGGLGAVGKLLMQPQAIDDLAKSLIAQEYRKWDVGQGDTPGVFLERVGRGVREKIGKGEYDDPRLRIPGIASLVGSAAGSMKYDPKNDPIWHGATEHIKTGKAGGSNTATSSGPTQVSGERQEGDITGSGSQSTSRTSTQTAPSSRYIPGQSGWTTPRQEKKYIPWNPDAGKLYPKAQGVPDELLKFQSKPIAYLRPDEEEEYLRNLALMGYAGRYA